MANRYRVCPGCKYRYEKIKQKCPSCGKARPKKRVPKHAITLRDDSYEHYVQVSKEIHGNGDGSCDVCRRLPSATRRHDRDHDHTTGNPRGLACPGRHGCNRSMPYWLTAHKAQLIADYLKRVETYYTKPEGKSGSSSQSGLRPG